jgi:hypothetical protein
MGKSSTTTTVYGMRAASAAVCPDRAMLKLISGGGAHHSPERQLLRTLRIHGAKFAMLTAHSACLD